LGFVAVDLANLDDVLSEGRQSDHAYGEGGGAQGGSKRNVHDRSLLKNQHEKSEVWIVLQTLRLIAYGLGGFPSCAVSIKRKSLRANTQYLRGIYGNAGILRLIG
jgi:hypothetical protein